MEKPTLDQYPPTDERTFINLKDGSINWKKYAQALDDYIMERGQYKNEQPSNCNKLLCAVADNAEYLKHKYFFI